MPESKPQEMGISLTSIYQAVRKPDSSGAAHLLTHVKGASMRQVDYTLRNLLSYQKHKSDKWPPHRLIACLQYVYKAAIRKQLVEWIHYSSLKACLRWILEIIATIEKPQQTVEEEHQTLHAVKFLCAVLEDTASASFKKSSGEDGDDKAAAAAATLIGVVRGHHGVRSLLSLTYDCKFNIRVYSVRALTAQIRSFSKDMLHLDAYAILTKSVLNMRNSLRVLALKQPVTDATDHQDEFNQSMMVCQLLKTLIEHDKTPHAKQRFAATESFEQMVDLWEYICRYDYGSLMDVPLSNGITKNQRLVVYLLTSIVHACLSESTAALLSSEESRAKWQPLLTLCLQRWIRGTCCTLNDPIYSPLMIDQDKRIAKKLLQLSLDVLPKSRGQNADWIDRIVYSLTNFIMAYVSQPILPEIAVAVGETTTLLSTDLCIDVEERGYQVSSESLQGNQDLFVLVLESFIQHVQQATPCKIQLISKRAAWCIKSMMTVWSNAGLLEIPSVQSRLSRLAVFFLHYDDAIDSFAASTTSISRFIWGPTIEIAKKGLTAATELTQEEEELTPLQSACIIKAKRAFVSLELISKHPRACERLVDNEVLQLVDISLIPPGTIIQKTTSLLSVYALFGRFVAALSRRTAFVRTKLRDQCNVIPLIMKLLYEAVQCKEARRVTANNDVIQKGWNHVISSCLMVISSFQYDEASMHMWLSWTASVPEEQEQDTKQQRSDVIPTVLSVLFPWRNHTEEAVSFAQINEFLMVDDEVIQLAAQLLDQFSSLPLCGRLMIRDTTALYNMNSLMVCLTSTEGVDSIQRPYQLTYHVAAYPDNNANLGANDAEDILAKLSSAANDDDNEDNNEEEVNNDDVEMSDAPLQESSAPANLQKARERSHFNCAVFLKRAAIRILTVHDNLQYILLSDAFTCFFKPMLQHPISCTSHEYWRRKICDDLFCKKKDDFLSLLKFTEVGDKAIKLNEMTAIAVGYCAIGSTSDQEWNGTLGLAKRDNSIVQTRHVFGTLCQMLVYELEYEESQDIDEVNMLLVEITPHRRNAAAQVLESLALEFEVIWRVETDSVRENLSLPQHLALDRPHEIVTFVTDQSQQFIYSNRQLLRARSPVFEALLSADYVESSLEAIPLHDITFHSLQLFISVIHQLNEKTLSMPGLPVVDEVLPPTTCWEDIVDLLQISDRFGSTVVKSLCEHWVLEKVKHIADSPQERLRCLEGMMGLYRHCYDPMEKEGGIESEIWPFATVLRESLKMLLLYMSESSQTEAFSTMVKDRNGEELDVFCDAVASLLRK